MLRNAGLVNFIGKGAYLSGSRMASELPHEISSVGPLCPLNPEYVSLQCSNWAGPWGGSALNSSVAPKQAWYSVLEEVKFYGVRAAVAIRPLARWIGTVEAEVSDRLRSLGSLSRIKRPSILAVL